MHYRGISFLCLASLNDLFSTPDQFSLNSRKHLLASDLDIKVLVAVAHAAYTASQAG
jgi:hypothetical protein